MKTISSKPINHTITSAYELFKTECRIRNLASATIEHYNYCVLRFSKYIECDTTPISSVNSETIRGFIQHMANAGLKPSSININLTGVRAFLYWAMEQGFVAEFKIRHIKADETEQPVYTEEDLLKLTEKPKTDKFDVVRNWCIVCFAIATGVRVRTLCSINIEDILLDEEAVMIRQQKNRKIKKLPLSSGMVKILKNYIWTYLADEAGDFPLFPSSRATRMRATTMQSAIHRYNNSRGVEITAMHGFRRAYAKMYIKNGGRIEMLKELMCHSSIKQTEKYYDLYTDDLRQGYEELNPLQQLVGKTSRTIKTRNK